MKLQIYKNTDDNFQDIYEDAKEVQEVRLKVGNTILIISEHQMGIPLDEPHIDIITDISSYSADFDTFIKNGIR